MSSYAVHVAPVLDGGDRLCSAADALAPVRVGPGAESLADALPGSASAAVATELAQLLDRRLALLHRTTTSLGAAWREAGAAYAQCEDTVTAAMDDAR
ncbi:hypothetical protein [Arsenicicoccus sp. oral taxon 190]|uniref:hypothetical protein n=1 Tax=Arsenicicoccus sp. oral taxon 190 TaxID=1658671 RepID=UPI00067A051F|nr:hypothetical protein [Arsenicicoccus sp. oral taxon 190]AKT52157.1 hypothetical protein ADJ73_14325 [Arsenicicoccus sp. oral taxon 190]